MFVPRIIVVLIAVSWSFGEEQDTSVVGIVGRSVRLPCDLPTSDPADVDWVDLVYNTGRDPQPIYSSADGLDPSHVNTDNFRVSSADFSLTISRLKLEQDAGQYICRSRVDGEVHHKSYYLTVGEMPRCFGDVSLRQGSSTKLNCEAQYSGTLQPVLEWSRDGVPVSSVDDFEIMLARHFINVNSVGADDDQVQFSCQMSFGDMTERCSLTLDVAYLVRDVSFSPSRAVLTAGEELRCTARGNPSPVLTLSVEALDSSNTVTDEVAIQHGPGWRSLTVSDKWIDKQLTVICTATNSVDSIQQMTNNSINFNVIEGKTEETSSASDGSLSSVVTSDVSLSVIIAVVIITLLVVAAAVVAFLLVKRRKDRKLPPKGAKPLPTKEELMSGHSGSTNGQGQAV